jgi:hypothetical protein
MPLQKIQFKPGFNKQQTATGAEGQWIDGDNIRFRYGEPQKIGGFQQLVAEHLSRSCERPAYLDCIRW